MRLIFWLIVVLTFFGSCTNKNQESLDHIKKVQQELKFAETKYHLDSSFIAGIRKDVKLRSRMPFDTSSSDLRQAIISFGNIDRRLKQSLKMDKVIRADLTKIDKQLSDLYHDIVNNNLNENEFKKYIIEEEEIATSIIERMKYNQSRVTYELSKYDSLKIVLERHTK